MTITLCDYEALCRVIPYRHKGMFYSEVFLFLQSCARQSVQLIIESGVKNGMSTALLSAAWPGELISIDKASVPPEAVEGVDFMHGDARELIPQILKESASLRVAVLLDGPKGATALALMREVMRWPQVRSVGIHDIEKGRYGESWHSHHREFRASVGNHLDDIIQHPYRKKYQDGPGLGIWEKGL